MDFCQFILKTKAKNKCFLVLKFSCKGLQKNISVFDFIIKQIVLPIKFENQFIKRFVYTAH